MTWTLSRLVANPWDEFFQKSIAKPCQKHCLCCSLFPTCLCLQVNCCLSYVWFYIHITTGNSLTQEREVGLYSREHRQKSSAQGGNHQIWAYTYCFPVYVLSLETFLCASYDAFSFLLNTMFHLLFCYWIEEPPDVGCSLSSAILPATPHCPNESWKESAGFIQYWEIRPKEYFLGEENWDGESCTGRTWEIQVNHLCATN